MSNDDFFTKQTCDRCKGPLGIRTMSWFTTETICIARCKPKEQKLRTDLAKRGIDTRSLEGCGYIPSLDEMKGRE